MLNKTALNELYNEQGKSIADIAKIYHCSQNKVNYWFEKYNLRKRTIADAIYLKNNQTGNPFKFYTPKNSKDWMLFGMGLGLYWGEGTKANKNSVRLGNTDPDLIKVFIDFLERIYLIDKTKLRFSIQIFSDLPEKEVLNFWLKHLQVSPSQFYKTRVTRSIKNGTYTRKIKYGVITLYFNNTRLRHELIQKINLYRKA